MNHFDISGGPVVGDIQYVRKMRRVQFRSKHVSQLRVVLPKKREEVNAREVLTLLSGWLGVYMTPESLNRNNSKWPEVIILFILDLFLTKFLKIISR